MSINSRRPKVHMHLAGGNSISIRDLETLNPGSVWCSLLSRADWLNKLDISDNAKRLTRLKGKFFISAANKIIKRW